MQKETKFGYGFLFLGVGVTYLVEKYFGSFAGTVSACLFVLVGGCLLIAGHLHGREALARKVSLGFVTSALIIASVALGFHRKAWQVHKRPPEQLLHPNEHEMSNPVSGAKPANKNSLKRTRPKEEHAVKPGQTVSQWGRNNIAQIGHDNQATINESNPNEPIIVYTFEREKRTDLRNGTIQVGDFGQMPIYEHLRTLMLNKQWKELAAVSEAEITRTPLWLTPYLMAGLAYANLCSMEKARERLNYVIANAGGNPDYSDASRILQQLGKDSRCNK